MSYFFNCINCGFKFESEEIEYYCPKCNDLLEILYNLEKLRNLVSREKLEERVLSVWKYKELLPIKDLSKIVSLGEGGTTLHKCENLSKILNLKNLFVKNEGENPTGSFKDRGMTVAISKALERNIKIVACASTGNTSASLAAYAAKAGIKSVVLIPEGKVALGKIIQAIIHGAKIIQINGNFDEALKAVKELVKAYPQTCLLNSINPFRIEGQKTLAMEICSQLGYNAPDAVILPVGNAGNISAVWKGFYEFKELGLIQKVPRIIGIQADKAAPLVKAFKEGRNEISIISNPETIATAIKIGAPASWKKALKAVKHSNGLLEAVTDDEIIEAQKLLARREGIFVEPASAASIAGLKKLLENNQLNGYENIVCITTGHGLKDPETVLKTCVEPLIKAFPTIKSLKETLEKVESF
ncbi:threonine synthase [Candidatus Bathyarchaeota archaeon]|nr:threonine synthase [Candidatus Bathyarchaeota archaeon]